MLECIANLTSSNHARTPRSPFLPTTNCIINPSFSPSSAGKLVPEGSAHGKLGYIRVATFSKQTAEKVRAALQELKAQVGSARCCRQRSPLQELLARHLTSMRPPCLPAFEPPRPPAALPPPPPSTPHPPTQSPTG